MSKEFGDFLRNLRLRRGISQAQLARRAGISERSLRYWETGGREAGQWEMANVLGVLEVSAQERMQALAFLTTPRGIQRLRQEADKSTFAEADFGPMPSTGELMQAMRIRRGLSQEQMANALGVSVMTILRWEATRSFPSTENLHRVCLLLQAYPEEEAALSSRQLHLWGKDARLSLEECAEQVELLDERGFRLMMPLADLYALALKRQVWAYVDKTEEALRLMAKVHVVHASCLMRQDRNEEMQINIQRGLSLLRPPLKPELFWQAAINLATLTTIEQENGNAAPQRLLRQWLPAFPTEMQSTLWCDLAVYAAHEGENEVTEAYLATARELIPKSVNAQAMTEHYYPLTRARTFLSAGRPAEALAWLPHPGAWAAASIRAAYGLLWAEAYLKSNDKDAAQRCLDELNTLFLQYSQPRYQRKFAELSIQL